MNSKNALGIREYSKFVKVFVNLKIVYDFKYVHEFKKLFMVSQHCE